MQDYHIININFHFSKENVKKLEAEKLFISISLNKITTHLESAL